MSNLVIDPYIILWPTLSHSRLFHWCNAIAVLCDRIYTYNYIYVDLRLRITVCGLCRYSLDLMRSYGSSDI